MTIMKYIAMAIASAALAATIVPVLLFMNDTISFDQMKTVMAVAMVAWFVTAPMFMWKEKEEE